MSERATTRATVKEVELLVVEKFRTEPFHNLYLRYGYPQASLDWGGTCSDKTISFLEALRAIGVTSSLHSGFIDGREIHRLVKLFIGDSAYFADVGNGWPAIKLYPLDRGVSYGCFGMTFRTEIQGRRMVVFNTRNGVERRQVEIDFDGKPEAQILEDIAARFDGRVEYPFSKGVRFSQIVGDRFLFLRDTRLEIYSEGAPLEVIDGLHEELLPSTLYQYFGFDIDVLAAGREPSFP